MSTTKQLGVPRLFCMAGKTVAGHDRELVAATGHKPFKTDFCSLIAPQGEGIEFGEVCRAICVTAEGKSDGLPDPESGCQVREGYNYLDVNHRIVDGEVTFHHGVAMLSVPPEFRQVKYDWSAPSNAQLRPSPEQQAKLERCLKPFVSKMLTGVAAQLRLDSDEMVGAKAGQNLDAIISLSQDLALLLLDVGGLEKSVTLRSVRWVRPPDEDKSKSWFLPSDKDNMVVLRLVGGRFVRLRFTKKDQASYFGTCMRLLVKAARTEGASAASERSATSQATEPLLHQPSA